MTSNQKVRKCICGKNREHYDIVSVLIGLGISVLLLAVLVVLPIAIIMPILFGGLLLVAFMAWLTVNLSRKHTLVCSFRKAALDTIVLVDSNFRSGWSKYSDKQ